MKFIDGDLFTADIRPATVVMPYLLPSVNLKLRSRLQNELKPCTRTVSHSFDIDDWTPDKAVLVEGSQLCLWVIPDKKQARPNPLWPAAGRRHCSRRRLCRRSGSSHRGESWKTTVGRPAHSG